MAIGDLRAVRDVNEHTYYAARMKVAIFCLLILGSIFGFCHSRES